MKKYKSVLLNLVFAIFVVFLIPFQVYAATIYTEGNLLYVIEDGGITITGYTGNNDVVDIPDSIAGYPISKVASGAFSDKESVKTVNLPETIMEVESGAFSDTQTVTNMELANAETTKTGSTDEAFGNPLKMDDSGANHYGSAAAEEVEDGITNFEKETSVNGLMLDDSLITVDDNSHLIRIDGAGKTEVLDSENQYSVNPRQDGSTAIVRADGVALDLDDIPETKVRETESIKEPVKESVNEIVTEKETEITAENTNTTENGGLSTIMIIAIIIVAIAGVVVFLVSKTKKNKG